MLGGGLLEHFKAYLLKRPCTRCGLMYNHKLKPRCPFCGDLDEQGLARLFETCRQRHGENRRIARGFFAMAGVLLVLMLLLVL